MSAATGPAALCRTARPDEIALMLDWAAAEGWNPGLDDAAAFLAADPGGFFVAETGGRVVAAISVVNHDDAHAFLGLYLCRPEFRGRGIGFGLWRHALDHAGRRTVGLDGVAAQQENYGRSGFVRTGATSRLEGPAFVAPSPDPSSALRPFTPDDFERAAALDRSATGHGRARFLPAWLAATPTRRTVVMGSEGTLSGLATARLCRRGCKIGPVIARNTAQALALVAAAAATHGSAPLILDVPDSQPAFRAALVARGFTATFETARMYRGTPPRRDGTLQAVATLELG